MEFRKIGENELDSLVSMRISYLREDFSDTSDEQFDRIAKNLPTYFENHINKDLFAFGAFDDNKIVSVALLLVIEKPCNPRFISGKTGEVFNVYTLSEYRRQGLAMNTLQLLMEYAEELNLDIVNLKATKDGYPLYKKCGFVKDKLSCIPMRYSFE